MVKLDFVNGADEAAIEDVFLTASVLLHYNPRVAPSEADTVTEQADVVFDGLDVTDTAQGRILIRVLNQLFEHARQYQQTRIGHKTYVRFSPDIDGATATAEGTWRSEVFDGRVEIAGDALETWWMNGKIHATIYWTRRNYWEGATTTLNMITNTGGSGAPQVTLSNDPLNTWVRIANDIDGDVPAPVRVEIDNTYNNAARANVFHMGQSFQRPGLLAQLPTKERALDATGGTIYNTNYRQVSWSGTADTQLLSWSLSTANLNAWQGRFFRALLRFINKPTYTDLQLNLRVKLAVTTLFETGWQRINGGGLELHELSAMQLPPYLLNADVLYSGSLYPLTLTLSGKKASAGTYNLEFDYLQLHPMDGYRRLRPRGYSLDYQESLFDDGTEGVLYGDWANSNTFASWYVGEGALMVCPGRINHFYFLHDADNGGADVARTTQIRMSYRPRRSSL